MFFDAQAIKIIGSKSTLILVVINPSICQRIKLV
jgi:hypothetical protein